MDLKNKRVWVEGRGWVSWQEALEQAKTGMAALVEDMKEESVERRKLRERSEYWSRVERIAAGCLAAEWCREGTILFSDAENVVSAAQTLVDEIDRRRAEENQSDE